MNGIVQRQHQLRRSSGCVRIDPMLTRTLAAAIALGQNLEKPRDCFIA